jgi:protein dithiol oxidoreductase (disulfide-forming)
MIARKGFLALLLLVAMAPLSAAITEGRDFTRLPTAQPADTPGKIEVIEFFSYGCPHCYELEPLISKWKTALPADVAFKRVPVGFGRPMWQNLGKAYYAFADMKVLPKVDDAIFAAVHRQRLPLQDEKSILAWVAKQGIDAAKFAAAYNSFSVNTHMAQSERMVESYQVASVPSLVVGGKYVAGGESFEQMLSVTSELIAKVRAEKGKP